MNKINNVKIIEYIESKAPQNIAITGQNMSGKSKLLLDILKKKEKEKIYFISCNNRTINEDQQTNITRLEERDLDVKKILFQRIKLLEEGIDKDVLARGNNELISEVMNELFIFYYTKNELFKNKFDEFMNKFNLAIKIVIKTIEKNSLNDLSMEVLEIKQLKAEINGETVNLSTGMKAMTRLFIELWLAKENDIKEVYIDEIDMHIDQKNSILFLGELFEVFNEMRIISIIHNMSIISGVKDTLIISLYGDEPRIFDSNEYLDIRAIANDIYRIDSIQKNKETEVEKKINILLEKLYNSEGISDKDIKEYEDILRMDKLSFRAKDNLKIIGEIIEDVTKNSI